MKQIQFFDGYLKKETWELRANIFCPKRGTIEATVWENTPRDSDNSTNDEDNAGEYYLCTNCNHDWHMYPLTGYHGPKKTALRVREITR